MEIEDDFSNYIHESDLYEQYELFMHIDGYEQFNAQIKVKILAATLEQIKSLGKNQPANPSIPVEISLLGDRFNKLYKSWYRYLGYFVDPDSHAATDLPNTALLIDIALSELKIAKLFNKNYIAYQEEHGEKQDIEDQYGRSHIVYVWEWEDSWRFNACDAHLLLEHLHTKKRLEEIIKANQNLIDSPIYTSTSLLPNALMIAFGLVNLASANAMAANGEIAKANDLIFEAAETQKIVAKSLSKKMSSADLAEKFAQAGSRGGAKSNEKYAELKKYAFELARTFKSTVSARQIAIKIEKQVQEKAEILGARLVDENAHNTIYKYILEFKKNTRTPSE